MCPSRLCPSLARLRLLLVELEELEELPLEPLLELEPLDEELLPLDEEPLEPLEDDELLILLFLSRALARPRSVPG